MFLAANFPSIQLGRTLTALRGRWAIVVPSATMRVQNYAVSIKWQLLKVLLKPTRDLFAFFVQQ